MINKYIYGVLFVIISTLSVLVYTKEKELTKYKILENQLQIRAEEAEKQNKRRKDALERETKNIKIKYRTIYKEVTKDTTCEEQLTNRNEMLEAYIQKHSDRYNIDLIKEPMEIVEDEESI